VWVSGYWTQAADGWQWVPGFYTSSEQSEVEYLPQPPETVEEGPSIEQPSVNHFWVPGYWSWTVDHYAWRPGYWSRIHPDWVWVPAHYVWCPSGYVFIDGYWDYPVVRRGLLFAPVYFQPVAYHRHFYYTPRIVWSTVLLTRHLWVRPTYYHYYFGDFYDDRYVDWGIRPWYASFSFGRTSYDPLFSYYRWYNRDRGDWVADVRGRYDYYRRNRDLRPPRTYHELQQIVARGDRNVVRDSVVAAPITQIVNRTTVNNVTNTVINENFRTPFRFDRVAQQERRQIARQADDLRQIVRQRKQLETRDNVARVQDGDRKDARKGEDARVRTAAPRALDISRAAQAIGATSDQGKGRRGRDTQVGADDRRPRGGKGRTAQDIARDQGPDAKGPDRGPDLGSLDQAPGAGKDSPPRGSRGRQPDAPDIGRTPDVEVDRGPDLNGKDRTPGAQGKGRAPDVKGIDRGPDLGGKDRGPDLKGKDRLPDVKGIDRGPDLKGRERTPEIPGRGRSPDRKGPDRGPDLERKGRGPDVKGPDRSPDAKGVIRAPDIREKGRLPDTQGPDRRTIQRGPDRAPSTRGPDRAPDVSKGRGEASRGRTDSGKGRGAEEKSGGERGKGRGNRTADLRPSMTTLPSGLPDAGAPVSRSPRTDIRDLGPPTTSAPDGRRVEPSPRGRDSLSNRDFPAGRGPSLDRGPGDRNPAVDRGPNRLDRRPSQALRGNLDPNPLERAGLGIPQATGREPAPVAADRALRGTARAPRAAPDPSSATRQPPGRVDRTDPVMPLRLGGPEPARSRSVPSGRLPAASVPTPRSVERSLPSAAVPTPRVPSARVPTAEPRGRDRDDERRRGRDK
jgi:hypothetical protein